MSLFDELSEFIGESHVAREITFKNKTRTFHFRELNAGEAEDSPKRKRRNSRMISPTSCRTLRSRSTG
jgi:hypothetical protein